VNAETVTRQLERLAEAGAKLRRRAPEEVLDVLAQLFDAWSTDGSPQRRALEAALPEATGFSAAVVREGLRRGLQSWTGEAFRALVEREIGTRPSGDAGSTRSAVGFETTAVILAGSIPMPTLLAIAAPLALQSPVMVKLASGDRVTARHVARSIAALDPLLGHCVTCVELPRDDRESIDALLTADCVVATGSDETVTDLGARVRSPRRLVRYGHRLSVAVVAGSALDGPRVEETARNLALDVALWDQLGCLSPVAAYVLAPEAGSADRFGEALARALGDAERRLPRGVVGRSVAAQIARERAEAEMRAAGGAPVAVHASTDTSWTVVREADSRWRATPLHRFVRVVPVKDGAELIEALAPVGRNLAAVGVAGIRGEITGLFHRSGRLGASRICPLGSMQCPPLAWCHDNRGVLEPLARFTDLEPCR